MSFYVTGNEAQYGREPCASPRNFWRGFCFSASGSPQADGEHFLCRASNAQPTSAQRHARGI